MKTVGAIFLITGFLLVWAERSAVGVWWKFGIADIYVGFEAISLYVPLWTGETWVAEMWWPPDFKYSNFRLAPG